MMRFTGLTSVLMTLLAAHEARAEVNPRMMRSPRHMGMGDAGVAAARGLDAIFYNPAGLALSPSLFTEAAIASPLVTAGSNARTLYKDIKSKRKTGEILTRNMNKPQHVGVQNVTGVAFRRAAIGLLQSADANVYFGNDSSRGGLPVAQAEGQARAGAYFSLAKGFAGETILFGTTLKYVQTARASVSYSALEIEKKIQDKSLSSAWEDALERGSGVGADVAVIFRAPRADSRPSLGIVARNLGLSYRWAHEGASRAPAAEATTVDVGIALEPGTKKSRSLLVLDFVDVLNRTRVSPYKRIFAGAELSFLEVLGVTGGLHQGYPTYGAFFSMKILRIDGGVTSEELGQHPGDRASRRYFARASIGWNP